MIKFALKNDTGHSDILTSFTRNVASFHDSSVSSLDQTKFNSRILCTKLASSPNNSAPNLPCLKSEDLLTVAEKPQMNEDIYTRNKPTDQRTKNRGKFISPFPEACQFYSRPAMSHKYRPFKIKNRKILPPRQWKKIFYGFTCTSTIDSIFIIFIHSFFNVDSFSR